jgi:hypothetical protein
MHPDLRVNWNHSRHAAQSCVLVSTSQLRVVPHEFVIGAQPVFDAVTVLAATSLVQTERELQSRRVQTTFDGRRTFPYLFSQSPREQLLCLYASLGPPKSVRLDRRPREDPFFFCGC